LKLDLDDQERQAVGKSLVDRKVRLIESIEDTQTQAARRSGLFGFRRSSRSFEN
jgi:hypothetical protein